MLHACTPLALCSCLCRAFVDPSRSVTLQVEHVLLRERKQQNGIFFLLFFKSKWSQCCPVNDNINEQNWNCIGQKSGCNAVRRPKRKGNGQTSIKCRSQLQEMTHLHCYLAYANSTNFLWVANSLVHNMYDFIHDLFINYSLHMFAN